MSAFGLWCTVCLWFSLPLTPTTSELRLLIGASRFFVPDCCLLSPIPDSILIHTKLRDIGVRPLQTAPEGCFEISGTDGRGTVIAYSALGPRSQGAVERSWDLSVGGMSGSDLVDRSRTYSVPLIHSVVSEAVEYLYCRPTATSHATGPLDHQVRAPMTMSAGSGQHRRGAIGPDPLAHRIRSHFEVDAVGRRGTVTCVPGTVQLMALSRLDPFKGRVWSASTCPIRPLSGQQLCMGK